MKPRSSSKKDRLAAIILIICGALALAVFLLFPNLIDFDLGAANAQYRHEIDDSERSAYFDELETDLPLIYASVEDISLLYPDWQWTADGSSGAMPPREDCPSEVFIFNNGSENRLTDNPAQYFGSAVLRLRGRTSSYTQNKKPFKLEIYDESGKSFNQPVLSLPAESDFVLVAPYNDRSLIRNWLAYTLGLEFLEYSPRCEFVELVVNQKGEALQSWGYRGVYLLTESLKPSLERINIGGYRYPIAPSRWFEEGGGYIVKQDHYEPGFEDSHLLMPTPAGEVFMIVSPKYGELTYEDADAIKAELDFFEDIIINGSDEQLDYYLDIDSFVDMILLNEYLKNSEGMIFSAYYYRAKGGKLTCGPPWDFDIGTGNVDYNEQLTGAEGFYTLTLETTERLLNHPVFKERLIERWRELRSDGGSFSDTHISELIDYANALLKNAAERNDAAFPELYDGSREIFGNSVLFHPQSSLEDREMIREFLMKRGAWLDANIGSL